MFFFLGGGGQTSLLWSSKMITYYSQDIYHNYFTGWVDWGIFAVIPGYPRGADSDSQHLEAHPELQDWLWSELFTVKTYTTGPFSK